MNKQQRAPECIQSARTTFAKSLDLELNDNTTLTIALEHDHHALSVVTGERKSSPISLPLIDVHASRFAEQHGITGPAADLVRAILTSPVWLW